GSASNDWASSAHGSRRQSISAPSPPSITGRTSTPASRCPPSSTSAYSPEPPLHSVGLPSTYPHCRKYTDVEGGKSAPITRSGLRPGSGVEGATCSVGVTGPGPFGSKVTATSATPRLEPP